MAIITEAKVSLVRMNPPVDPTNQEQAHSPDAASTPQVETAAEADDQDSVETVEDEGSHLGDRISGDIDVLLHSLSRETRVTVLDAQLTQLARALVQNRLDSETEKVKIFINVQAIGVVTSAATNLK